MSEIIKRAWKEPAVAIGLLVTVALAVGALATGSDWSWETIIAVLSPLLAGLGIRPLVSPVGSKPVAPVSPAGTTKPYPDPPTMEPPA